MKKRRSGTIYEKYVKRALDVVLACFLLTAFCWLYAIVAIVVKLDLGSPVIFRQERAGKDEKVFKILKFRTMTQDRDENGELYDDEKRVTKLGRFLRSTSLDEIPEVFNVLRGEMSFVGPRPLLKEYLAFYTVRERKRHAVRPGITGLAQINGRNSAESWEKRFEYDLKYVENVTFSGDAAIFFKSFKTVFSRSGVEHDGGIKEGPLDKTRSER
ncbi:MAG: sugar transferase [Clostridia bacterium]|nr:sugar transferase [Clostridia bacterium]